MREWYVAAELAGSPGMPKYAPDVRRKARRENWLSQPRDGKKKWLEYHFDSLPYDTQIHLEAEHEVARLKALDEMKQAEVEMQARTEDLCDAEKAVAKHIADKSATEAAITARITEESRRRAGLEAFNNLPDSPSKEKAIARHWFVENFAAFRNTVAVHELRPGQQKSAFLNKVNDLHNPLRIPAEYIHVMGKRGGKPHLSRSSFYRWLQRYDADGIPGLMDQYRGIESSIIESTPGMREVVLGGMVNRPHINGKQLNAYLEAEHPEFSITCNRTLDRFIARFKEEESQQWIFMSNPDRWKNQFMSAFGSQHESVTAVNDIWELDSTPADFMLQGGRHSVVGCIDMFSRDFRLYVSKSSTASAVKSLLRRTLVDWGKPKMVRTDNGKDYVSIEVKETLKSLKIEQLLCVPFASEEKGTVERAFRTMSHGILELLPGFIGHNVTERKEIESRKSFAKRIMTRGETVELEMTPQQLQEILDQWVENGKSLGGG